MNKVNLTTTLALLRTNGACTNGYRKLLKSIGADYPADKPINILRILKSNGVPDAMWCLRATREDCIRVRVAIAAAFAKSVLKYYTKQFPTDTRVTDCIKTCIKFSQGKATQDQLSAAGDAAWAAARDAAGDAAWAAARDAAGAAAGDAAWAAAGAAAGDAAWAAAGDAAWAAARDAAGDAETKKQAAIIRKFLK